MLKRTLQNGLRLFEFLSHDCEPGSAHASVAGAGFLLYLVDELDEFRNGVHTQ
jgi:hypothetical protein